MRIVDWDNTALSVTLEAFCDWVEEVEESVFVGWTGEGGYLPAADPPTRLAGRVRVYTSKPGVIPPALNSDRTYGVFELIGGVVTNVGMRARLVASGPFEVTFEYVERMNGAEWARVVGKQS